MPLDEYSNYTGRVVAPLRQGYDADQELWPSGTELIDELPLQRNGRHAALVKEVATLLEGIRCEWIGDTPKPDVDRSAAETLIDWYRWEMQRLAGRS